MSCHYFGHFCSCKCGWGHQRCSFYSRFFGNVVSVLWLRSLYSGIIWQWRRPPTFDLRWCRLTVDQRIVSGEDNRDSKDFLCLNDNNPEVHPGCSLSLCLSGGTTFIKLSSFDPEENPNETELDVQTVVSAAAARRDEGSHPIKETRQTQGWGRSWT